MMPTILPAEGDNLTHTTGLSHRSDNDGSLSPHFVNRYPAAKSSKKSNKKQTKTRKFDNNEDLRLSQGIIGLKEAAAAAVESEAKVINIQDSP